MINTNSKFLEEMIDTVREIGKNYNGLKAYLNNSEDIKQNEKEFKNEVHNLSLTLDGDLELKQNTLEALNQKFKSYYKSILLVYENSFFKNIKEYNQKLLYLMDKIIIEFEPPKSNSLVNSDANIEIKVLLKILMKINSVIHWRNLVQIIFLKIILHSMEMIVKKIKKLIIFVLFAARKMQYIYVIIVINYFAKNALNLKYKIITQIINARKISKKYLI